MAEGINGNERASRSDMEAFKGDGREFGSDEKD